jgi:hypothetical protein
MGHVIHKVSTSAGLGLNHPGKVYILINKVYNPDTRS